MQRQRLYDWRVSSDLNSLGVCTGDAPQAAQIANSAQTRLIMCREAGSEGWYGTWAEMAFTLSRLTPYLTTPREVARLEAVDVCDHPVQLSNQFGEYMRFGNGRMPKQRRHCRFPLTAVYTRNSVPTFVDLTNTPQFIVAVATDPSDVEAAKRVFIQGQDSTGNVIYTTDNGIQVTGQFLTLQSPFVVSPQQLNSLNGLQKDITNGPVQFFQLDPNTGAQILLGQMNPSETVASYRRYYFDQLPRDCCHGAGQTAQVTVTAIVKLEPIAMVADTDYFTLQGDAVLEAITEEAFANRYRKMDSAEAKAMAASHHKEAVGILNGILNQYVGKEDVAVQFTPFGSARLSKLKLGMI